VRRSRKGLRVLTAVRVVAALVCAPLRVFAQQPPAGPEQNHIIVEQIDHTVFVSPDARFTTINGDFGALVGAYGGGLINHSLLVGAGAYWLAQGGHDSDMWYAGPVAGFVFHGRKQVGFGVRGLIGGGSATLAGRAGDLIGDTGHGFSRAHRVITSDTRIAVRDDFFVAEPQGTAFWKLNDWLRVDGGVGYRLVGATDLGDRLRGLSGNVSVQIGK
jgi:hypothetical protein